MVPRSSDPETAGATRPWTGLALAVCFSAAALAALVADDDLLRPPSRLAAAFAAHDVAKLAARLDAAEYSLKAVRDGAGEVPRLLLSRLPDDWGETGPARKALFIRSVLPLVLEANRKLAADRRRLLDLDRWQPLPERERQWRDGLAHRFGVAAADRAELLRRVDVVPPSLALAQAALESGWGRSRFARQGNALFGQWSWTRGSGLEPAAREPGASHEVRSFASLLQSVTAYMHTLNTHPAYAEFRARRGRLRAAGGALIGPLLAATLGRYSIERDVYVAKLDLVIRANRLGEYDGARFRVWRRLGLVP